MPRDHYRRPTQRDLRKLYDGGVAAVEAASPCPYNPDAKPGDAIRATLWRQGFEDESDRLTVAELV